MTPRDQVTVDPPVEWFDTAVAPRGVRRAVSNSDEVVVKRGTGRARARLRHEADLLRRLADAPIVGLLDVRELDDATELVLADAGRRTIAELDLGTPDLTLRALQRFAEAVAELHRRGWSHGAICGEHAVVNRRGTVRLCSLGSARPAEAGSGEVDDDLSGLLAVVEHIARRPLERRGLLAPLLHRAPDRQLERVVERARRLRARGGLGADTVARELDELRRARAARRPIVPLRPRSLLVGAVVAIAAIGVWVTRSTDATDADPQASASSTTASNTTASNTTAPTPGADSSIGSCAGPTVDVDGDGCDDTVRIDGEIVEVDGVRYALGIPGDTAVVGDWDCDGLATARVLRGTTGEVFEFPGWATAATDEVGRHLGTVDGAVGAVRGDDPTEIGCDVLYVIGPDGTKEQL